MSIPLARFLQILIILSLPILLVMGFVRLLITDQYVAFEYAKTSFPADLFGFDQSQRLAYASANFRYVRENQPVDALARQQLGGQPLYNERELKHMQDVQNVYRASMRVWYFALGLTLLVSLALAWKVDTRRALFAAVQTGGLVAAGLVLGIGFLAVIGWQVWFVAFHQVFFAPGTWTFNTSDTLIRLFPEKFWFDAALTISVMSLAGGLLLTLIGWRYKRKR
ncbi:MAG: TIGR01906 family membrane protein [Anaerolineales bacterium]